MPVKDCQIDGKAGYKCGDAGKCYSISEHGRKGAFDKACAQCTAMGAPCTDED